MKLVELNKSCEIIVDEIEYGALSAEECSYLAKALDMQLSVNKAQIQRFIRKIGLKKRLDEMADFISKSGVEIKQKGSIMIAHCRGEWLPIRPVSIHTVVQNLGYRETMRFYPLLYSVLLSPDVMSAIATVEAVKRCQGYANGGEV